MEIYFLLFVSKFDIWQGDLKLSGRKINKVSSFKYLGVELNDSLDDKFHIEKRIKSAQISVARLRKLEILRNNSNAYLKGHIYKTYIMPILHYGLESINLTKGNVNLITRAENNIIRGLYGVPKLCRTHNLRLINNIYTTDKKLKVSQISFFERLLSNEHTNKTIKELLVCDTNHEYISQVLKILDEINYESELNILDKCNYYKYINEMDNNTEKKNNSTLNELRIVFDKWNGDKQRIFELTKYEYQN